MNQHVSIYFQSVSRHFENHILTFCEAFSRRIRILSMPHLKRYLKRCQTGNEHRIISIHDQTTKFGLVQIETICKGHFKVHLKWKI